jgi:hypothetical protein
LCDPEVDETYLIGRHCRADHAHKVGDGVVHGREALVDRRRVTVGAPVGGSHAATLDGSRGERGGRGEMGLTDWGGAIAVTDSPSTTRSTHRGRATALNSVLLVSGIRLPNNTSDVGGNRDLCAERRHSCGCGCGWWWL